MSNTNTLDATTRTTEGIKMSNLKLNEKEITDAQNALNDWFVSQDITPVDGVKIMMALIAEQMVYKTKDVFLLAKAVQDTSKLLSLYVLGYLRGFK